MKILYRILLGIILIVFSNCRRHYCGSVRSNVCTMEYRQVCGWFNSQIRCFRYPCAAEYSNPCVACSDYNVEYYTFGACPQAL